MFTDLKSKARILTTAAMTALIAGGAYAQTATVTADTEAEVQAETENNAVVEGAESVAEGTENAMENAGDAIAEGAEATGEAIQDGAAATGEAISEGAETVQEGAAATADAVEDAVTGADAAMDPTLEAMTVGDIIGKNVLSAEGEDVGEIDYVIMNGTDLSFVIGVGGFLGLGEHTVAIPMDRFSVTADNELQLAVMTEEELKSMPEVDESGLESLPDDAIIGELK